MSTTELLERVNKEFLEIDQLMEELDKLQKDTCLASQRGEVEADEGKKSVAGDALHEDISNVLDIVTQLLLNKSSTFDEMAKRSFPASFKSELKLQQYAVQQRAAKMIQSASSQLKVSEPE